MTKPTKIKPTKIKMSTKKITLKLLFFILTTVASAQQLYLEAGKVSSSFDYKNSQGVGLDNMHATTNSFMTVGYRSRIFTEKLKMSFGLGYAGYGAVGSDDVLGNMMTWDVNYLELGAGLDFRLLSINKSAFYVKAMTTVGFLTQGTQTLNNRVIDLKNQDDFDQAMVNFKAGVGFSHPVSDDLSFYVQYLVGKSANQADDGDNESLKIKNHNISFGVLIELFQKGKI